MNCCGKKRAQLKLEMEPINHNSNETTSSQANENLPKVFKYTGRESKIIKGAITGMMYHFKASGEKVSVAYEDSFAMMGENDVRISS